MALVLFSSLFTTAYGESVIGSDEITVTLSSAQIADGFTTAAGKIEECEHLIQSATAAGISPRGIASRTANSIVFKMTGDETEAGGHRITVTFRK